MYEPREDWRIGRIEALPDDAEDVRFARGVAVAVTLTFVGWSALWLAWRLV